MAEREGAVVAFLRGLGIAEGRVYTQWMPQNSPLPSVVIMMERATRPRHLRGADGRTEAEVAVETYGATLAQAKVVADAIKASLNGYTGPAGDALIAFSAIQDEEDDFDPALELHGVGLRFKVTFVE